MAKRLKLSEYDSKAISTTGTEGEEISNTEKQVDVEQPHVSTNMDTVSTDTTSLEKGRIGTVSRMEVERSCTTSNNENIDQSTVTTGKLSSNEAEHPDIGQKRTRESSETPSQTLNESNPLFKFEMIVSQTKDSKVAEEKPVKVDIACLEGNREIVHQFFMYFGNRFNGEQIRSPK